MIDRYKQQLSYISPILLEADPTDGRSIIDAAKKFLKGGGSD